MGFTFDDVTDDLRFSKRRYGNIEENQEQSEDLSVGFLMKKRKIFYLGTTDADYVMYLNSNLSILSDPPHELSVENGNDDPQYKLFLSRLRKDGSSYILEADERIGLTKPLKYEEEDESDDDYAFFCKNLRFSGDNICFQHDSDHSVMYDCQLLPCLPKDDNDDGPSSSKQMSKFSLHSKKFSSTIVKSEEERYSLKGKKFCKFRVKIMKILSKPYDKEEHLKLWQDITMQKPQGKHRDTRSGCNRFIESEKIGKSYLEYHGDLKRKVTAAAKDECKQLNLLRGFFFWIQNLTQEESFIPWNDDECLAARPESSW